MKKTTIRLIITLAMAISCGISVHAYHNISPYAWCGGNPVMCVDPMGEYLVGINRKHVTFKENGTLTNATKDIQRLWTCMKNSEKGQAIFADMVEANHPIKILINETDSPKYNGNNILGNTNTKVTQNKDQFKSVTIILYVSTMKEDMYNRKSIYYGLNLDDIIGANGVHEGTHATKKSANSSFADKQSAEKVACDEEDEYLKQIREHNEKTKE